MKGRAQVGYMSVGVPRSMTRDRWWAYHRKLRISQRELSRQFLDLVIYGRVLP